jgi:hypothetical protein
MERLSFDHLPYPVECPWCGYWQSSTELEEGRCINCDCEVEMDR